MNGAHLHLLFNHFPLIGAIFGLGIFIAGFFLKNNSIKSTALWLFIVTAIFTFISMATGDGAEELVEDLPTIGHQIIHEHEEIAEKLAIVLYLLGITSIASLYLNFKNHAKANIISWLVMVIAVVGVILAVSTGKSGGEIRHTEIRDNAIQVLKGQDE